MHKYRTVLAHHIPRLVPVVLVAIFALSGCNPAPADRTVTLLGINDIYRIEGLNGGGDGGIARLRSLRRELEREAPDLLVLHAGDMLFPSLLSRRYDGAQMIDALNWLDGDGPAVDERLLVTFGNHEFDKAKLKHASLLNDRLRESRFRWLGSNINFAVGADGQPMVHEENLVPAALIETGGVKVGVFSLTTSFKNAEYIEGFGNYSEVARRMTADLRQRGAEVVVALTHLLLSEDKALLAELGDAGPDLIVGGHEHLRQFADVNGRWVLKADADAFTATVIRLTVHSDGKIDTAYEYRRLNESVPADPAVHNRVQFWLARYDTEYCGELGQQSGCLDNVLGHTSVDLVAEELQIRQFETNFGNWVADQALAAFRDQGAQLAFINAGSLRLNRDIPAGPVTRRDLEETFAYPAPLKLLRVDGAALRQVTQRAVTDWTANGWWLQIAGFAFRHDPDGDRAYDLTLLGKDGPRPIRDDESLLVVTNDYLAGGNDGYTMLAHSEVVKDPQPAIDLKELVADALASSTATGIASQVEGRICNPLRPGPCLAVDATAR